MILTVFRNPYFVVIDDSELLRSDLILARDGNYHPVAAFPEFNARFQQPGLLGTIVEVGVAFVGTLAIAALAEEALSAIFPVYNYKPLRQSDRNYIRERDGEICYYCDEWDPCGHVDHMRSRRNGGGNEDSNLTWACSPCNLSKGSLNATEFLSL